MDAKQEFGTGFGKEGSRLSVGLVIWKQTWARCLG